MDFGFNSGPFDWGSAAVAPPLVPGRIGKQTSVTIGPDMSPIEAVEIADISIKTDIIDVTAYGGAEWKKSCAALKTGEAIAVTTRYPTHGPAQRKLHELADTGGIEVFRVWFPGIQQSWITFRGFISGVTHETPRENLIEFTFSISPVSEMRQYP